jgi:hypothetical protein
MVTPGRESTVEAGTHRSGGLGVELDRMEAAVAGGDTDLGRQGFWRVVGVIKRDDELIERHADQVGRIDATAFRAQIRFRAPVWVGTSLQVVGIATGVAAVAFATWNAHAPASERRLSVDLASGLGLPIAAFAWSAGSHTLVHHAVGTFVGIGFTDFFFEVPPPPLPGLKIDYASYLRASPVSRAWMHASGALASKLAPVAALAFAPATRAPRWSVAAVAAFAAGQVLTDVLSSTKASDWKKVRRELAVAQARRARPA